MTGELEAVADIATGTAFAHAVEPGTGQGQGSTDANCLNCGAVMMGTYCNSCGQKARVHRTLGAFGHDFLHSVLHFDGKIWRTLPMLVWRPGDLTRRYIHGERAKFVSPLALFLFTVFLTFAVFNGLMSKNANLNFMDETVSAQEAASALEADKTKLTERLTDLAADRKAALADGDTVDWIDREIKRNTDELKKLKTEKGAEIRRADLAKRKIDQEKLARQAAMARLSAKLDAAKKAGQPTEAIEDELEAERMAAKLMGKAGGMLNGGGVTIDSKDFTFTDLTFPGSDRLNASAKHAIENPQLLAYKVQSNAYKFSWALIPISVPFVWLLFFWRRKFKMFDHAVFVTYSLCFMMLLFSLAAVLVQYTATEVIGGLMMTMLPPVHLYRQLHHAYQTSRFGAFWRMCVLSLFALFALILFVSLILVMGVTG